MRNFYFTLILMLAASFAFGQSNPVKTITAGPNGTGTVTWSKDTTYLLDGFVFVNAGDTLTIEPGTVVKGKGGIGANASALIIARKGYCNCEGTASEPIIFTGESDDVTNPVDVPPHTTGLWGGLLVLGKACLNSAPGQSSIEGIPSNEPRGRYGAVGDSVGGTFQITEPCDDSDNSGKFAYISIRHGGTDIGAGNEINGFTLGGVGNQTSVHHIEVAYNADDGVEFFGGDVNTKYIMVAHVGDDAFDYDEGFRGKHQYWLAIQSDSAGSDRMGEHDGGTSPETATPYAMPVIYNATFIGRGTAVTNGRAVTFRDNAGGTYKNSIFVEQGRGIDIEILRGTPGSISHSYDQLVAGNLNLECNLFWNVAGNNASNVFTIAVGGNISTPDSAMIVDSAKTYVQNYFTSAGNTVADPMLANIPADRNNLSYNTNLDPTPAAGGPAFQGLCDYTDPFFDDVWYRGAFSGLNGDFWPKGWTYMDETGFFSSTVSIDKEELNRAITLYPNPSNGQIRVEMSGVKPAPVALEVVDMIGHVVYTRIFNVVDGEMSASLDLTQLPAGVYVVKATQNETVIGLERMLKQ